MRDGAATSSGGLDRKSTRSTARRGGGHEHEPLHEHTETDELPDPDADSDEAFNLMWPRAQVAHATNDLAGDYARRGLKDRFKALSTFIYREAEPGEYAELAPRLGLNTSAVASAVVWMRERHRLLVLGFVADTTASSEEEAAEVGELEGSLGRLVRWGERGGGNAVRDSCGARYPGSTVKSPSETSATEIRRTCTESRRLLSRERDSPRTYR